LLLLDEPFGALDAQVRKELRLWLRALHDRLGLTSLFVTHDQAEALEMSDRVAVLRAGRIEQVDAPDRLYAEPSSAFVHGFLGESLRFACVVAEGVAHFSDPGLAPMPTNQKPGPAVALIRPHEIQLLPGHGAGHIESVHATGPLHRIGVRLGPRLVELLAPANGLALAPGNPCTLDLSRARLYPEESPR